MRFSWLVLLMFSAFAVACGDDDDTMMEDSGTDSGMESDAGQDSGPEPDAGEDAAMPQDAGEDSGDVCAGKVLCDEEGIACNGDELVTCAEDEDGCLVENTEDCADVTGGYCNSSDATPLCDVDPCRGLDLCDTEGRACEDNTVVICATDLNGCLVETRTDCSTMGGACRDSVEEAACVTDPCAGVSDCDSEDATRCDGDTLYVCQKDAFGCLVDMGTDCSSGGATCGEDMGVNQCVGGSVNCATLPNACEVELNQCEGPELVDCSRDAFGCLVETRVDCTETTNGFCNGEVPTCDVLANDPCDGVSECTTLGRQCIGDDLVVCALDARGCQVETRATCGAGCNDDDVPVCNVDYCPAASDTSAVLSCMTPSVTGSMGSGTDLIEDYECTSFSYPRNEKVWRFSDTDNVHVTVSATRTTTNDDLDLYALDGLDGMTACGPATPCLDSSTAGAGTATEVVEFDYEPGDSVYIALDQFAMGATNSAQFTLAIECRVIECGNGFIEDGEECDDGNTSSTDGCSMDCQLESGARCIGQPSQCSASCGDGSVDDAESCDDDNTSSGDGCSSSCALEVPSAPNVSVDTSGTIESTDPIIQRTGFRCATFDSEPVNYDFVLIENSTGMDQTVVVEATWDDDMVGGYIAVFADDFSLLDPVMACVDSLQVPPTNPGELIVDIANGQQLLVVVGSDSETPNGAWDLSVRLQSCGDGNVDGDEECDDASGSAPGCADDCTEEPGYACTGEPSVCVVTCGDGMLDPDEDCDDMNRDTGDGCDDVCSIELGYECTDDEPSVCTSTCGDGVVNDSEFCDDMNMSASDGCAANCDVESGFFCGGEPSTCSMPACGNGMLEAGEGCDDMNGTGGDGCDTCALEIASPGSSVTIDGSIEDSDPRFTRAGAFGDVCARGGRANVFFDHYAIVNNTGTGQLLQVTAMWGGDGYLHIYGSGFDFRDEVAECRDGDDDFGSTAQSQVTMVPIAAGETLYVVASTFSTQAAIGDYSIEVLTQ